MNRTIFCNILKLVRKDSNLKLVDICAANHCLSRDIYRYESDKTNTTITRIITYLQTYQGYLQLCNEGQCVDIFDYNQLLQYLVDIRKSRNILTSRQSYDLKVSPAYMFKLENGDFKMSISILFTLLNYYQLNIRVKANGKLYTDSEE